MMKNTRSKALIAILALIGFVTILTLAAFACIGFSGLFLTDSASFYKNDGTYDAMYLPLIEPYKAVKHNGSSGERNGWSIDLIVPPEQKEIYYYTYLYDVTKVAVGNNVIMAYSPHVTSYIDESIGEKYLHWFVIVPDQKIETGFETEEEFLIYIHTLGIENPSWVDLDTAYEQFAKTKCLDWIPDCK